MNNIANSTQLSRREANPANNITRLLRRESAAPRQNSTHIDKILASIRIFIDTSRKNDRICQQVRQIDDSFFNITDGATNDLIESIDKQGQSMGAFKPTQGFGTVLDRTVFHQPSSRHALFGHLIHVFAQPTVNVPLGHGDIDNLVGRNSCPNQVGIKRPFIQ